jgi:hypothetical protein
MTEYLVAIAEGPNAPGGELEPWPRMALAEAGFHEAAQIEYPEGAVWGTRDDAPDPSTFRRIVYRYEADGEAEAAADAHAIIGVDFNIRVTEPRS